MNKNKLNWFCWGRKKKMLGVRSLLTTKSTSVTPKWGAPGLNGLLSLLYCGCKWMQKSENSCLSRKRLIIFCFQAQNKLKSPVLCRQKTMNAPTNPSQARQMWWKRFCILNQNVLWKSKRFRLSGCQTLIGFCIKRKMWWHASAVENLAWPVKRTLHQGRAVSNVKISQRTQVSNSKKKEWQHREMWAYCKNEYSILYCKGGIKFNSDEATDSAAETYPQHMIMMFFALNSFQTLQQIYRI